MFGDNIVNGNKRQAQSVMIFIHTQKYEIEICRKMGSTIPFRRKSSDIENKETEKKISGKDSVFKIVYKQVG